MASLSTTRSRQQSAVLVGALLALAATCSSAADPALGMLPTIQASTAYDESQVEQRQYIPRIIHQSYLPDEAALDRLSTAPRSHFRRDWRRSCQVHNPGYEYMFWDQTRANEFIGQYYPDMLPYYNRAPLAVLKSDILRVMILDKLGGVWLDIDTECFAPVDPILRGFHLVAQAEWTYQLCNSHVAGVPGHPIWRKLMEWFKRKVDAGIRDPLKHTGPVALTVVIKEHIQPANTKNMSLIAGPWVDPLYPSKFRAYGLQEAWFLPCKWARSYMTPCQGALARSKALVRQLSNGVQLSLPLLSDPATPAILKQMIQEAQVYQKVRGSHEYANSWTKWQFADGLKSVYRAKEALNGLIPFFSTPAVFEEYRGWVQGGCGDSEADVVALQQHQLCGAVLRAAVARGACRVLSVRGRRDEQSDPTNPTIPLALEQFVAQTYGCRVEVVTLQPRREKEVQQNGLLVVRDEPMQLGPSYDQYSLPPTLTLPKLLETVLPPGQNLTLLHIDCAGDCLLWDTLNQLQLTGSLALRRVGSLVLDLGSLPPRRRHMLNTVYQHLYQEAGFVGYSWGRSQVPRRGRGAWQAGEDEDVAAFGGGVGTGPTFTVQQRRLHAHYAHGSHSDDVHHARIQDARLVASTGDVRGKVGMSRQDAEHGPSTDGISGEVDSGMHMQREVGVMHEGMQEDEALWSRHAEGGAGSRQAGRQDSQGQSLPSGQLQLQRRQLQQLLKQAGVGRKQDWSLAPLRLGFARVL